MQIKQFGWIHGVACPSENEIHIAELLNWRLQKLIQLPAAPPDYVANFPKGSRLVVRTKLGMPEVSIVLDSDQNRRV